MKKSTLLSILSWGWAISAVVGYVSIAMMTYEPYDVAPITAEVVENSPTDSIAVELAGEQFEFDEFKSRHEGIELLEEGDNIGLFVDSSSEAVNDPDKAIALLDDGRYVYGRPDPHLTGAVFVRIFLFLPWAAITLLIFTIIDNARVKADKLEDRNLDTGFNFPLLGKRAYLKSPVLKSNERSKLRQARQLLKAHDKSLVSEFDRDANVIIGMLDGVNRSNNNWCRNNSPKDCSCGSCMDKRVSRLINELADKTIKVFKPKDEPLAFLEVLKEYEEKQQLKAEAAKEIDAL